MNKKGVNLVAIAVGVLVIIAIAVILVFVVFRKPTEAKVKQKLILVETKRSLEEQLMSVDTIETFQKLIEENALNAEFDDEIKEHVLYHTTCFDSDAQMTFKFEDSGALSYFSCHIILFGYEDSSPDNPQVKKYTVEDLINSNTTIFESFQKYLGIQEPNNFYILGDNEILDNQSTDSYQAIIDGKAYFEFSAEDSDGSLWFLEMMTTDTGVAYCFIEHYVDRSIYDEFIPNIYIE